MLILHGGWGYEMYPFTAQIESLSSRFRILIPDRSGYGKSPRLELFSRGFHEAAAQEMRDFLDALGVGTCVLWGHSDGAVTAIRMGLAQADRFSMIIAESAHYDRCKAASRSFFETAAATPRKFGNAVASAMAQEHGEDYWEHLMKVHGQAWLDILDHCRDPEQDLYSGRIRELACPTLLIHGSQDPRTEPGELELLLEDLPAATLRLVAGAGHSPHSESAYSVAVTSAAEEFLGDV